MRAQKIWQIVVGFLLGAFIAQLIGFFGILAVQIWRGHFEMVHLVHLSFRERLFIVILPIITAIPLVRRRPLVSAGMVLSAGFIWMVTSEVH
jgi:hypothetical protein